MQGKKMGKVEWGGGNILNKVVRKTLLGRCYPSKHCTEVKGRRHVDIWRRASGAQILGSIFDFMVHLRTTFVHAKLLRTGLLD